MTPGHWRRDLDRREFLGSVGLGLGGAAWASALARPGAAFAAGEGDRPKIAAVVTELRYRDHAHVILENFLEPYLFNGQRTEPGFEVAGLFIDQPGAGDMTRVVTTQYSIPTYPTIAE